jgi:hypothetical protein
LRRLPVVGVKFLVRDLDVPSWRKGKKLACIADEADAIEFALRGHAETPATRYLPVVERKDNNDVPDTDDNAVGGRHLRSTSLPLSAHQSRRLLAFFFIPLARVP